MGCFPNSPSENTAVTPQLPRPPPQSYQPYPQAPPPKHNSPQEMTVPLVSQKRRKGSSSSQSQPNQASKPKIPIGVPSQPFKPQDAKPKTKDTKIAKESQPSQVLNPKIPIGVPSQPFKPQDVKPKTKDTNIAKEIMSGFDVQKLMKKKLDSVAHTPDQLEYIIKEIVKAVVKLEQGQTPEENQAVAQILGDMDEKKLFYHHSVIKLRKLMKREARPETLSRIYHGIANLKKKQQVERKIRSSFNIIEKETNDYEVLTFEQMDEVVKYEAISQKILELGTKLNFQFNSIERDSNGTVHLLAQISSSHQKQILGFKYDLSPQEYKKAAQISRDACNHHDNGVVLLFIYFVRSCRKLEKNKEAVGSIEKKLEQAIQWISKEYPPGQGLEAGKKHFEGVLKKLQYEDKFAHQPSRLSSSGDKQAQLEKIILQNAFVAKRNRDNFQELIRQACFKHAIQTKVGLKLNPDHPNKKAMIRIKEKMLFGKAQNLEKKAKGTIQDTIDSEDKDYKEAIDRLLKEKDEVTFKISDMVRGKCVFLEVEDIILTVNQIKEFVRNDPKKRFRITEIESRFTNPQPISDVTLKIAINEQIVSELQLTIQANAAAYNFAHKVYELARTKVFSKVKISHNYFEEFAGDFKIQTSKALQIAKREFMKKDKGEEIAGKEADLREKYGILVKQAATIRELLDLQSMEAPKNYEEVMKQSIAEQMGELEGLTVSTDKKLQKLMVILFQMEMGSWRRELGQQIDQVLKSGQYPPLLKSTLLSSFYKSFDISKQLTPFLHFYPSYKETLEIKGNKEQQTKIGYMEMYLQQMFGIEEPFANIRSTARLFYKALQLQQITIKKQSSTRPSQLVVQQFIRGVVMEESGPENINLICQIADSFFMVRNACEYMKEKFNSFRSYIMSNIQKQPKLVSKSTFNKSLLLTIQSMLEDGKDFKSVNKTLDTTIVAFKEKEEIEQELLCELFLAECKANTDTFSEFRKYYAKNVVKKAEALGIELRGVAVANSEFRIYQKLWNQELSAEDQEYVLKTHLSKAITESSKSQGEDLLYKLVKVDRKGHKIDSQWIRQNQSVFHVNLSYNYEIFGKQLIHLESCRWSNLTAFYCIERNLGEKGPQYLSKAGFKKLTILDLQESKINAKGCQHLSKADWKNLSSLNLNRNAIPDEGFQFLAKADWPKLSTLKLYKANVTATACKYLSKTNWKSLSYVDLRENKIREEGSQHLSKANWPNISTIDFNISKIGGQGCEHLSKADWKNISSLTLSNCDIGDEGCKHLSKADWQKLIVLNLKYNDIRAKGCEHLKKAVFKNLTTLNLDRNQIGPEGCRHLSQFNWQNLTTLTIYHGKIGDEGCKHLSKATWKNLSTLNLDKNEIGSEGCEHLAQANFKNLTILILQSNNIDAEGCENLISGNWKKLTSLNLQYNNIQSQEKPILKELWKQKFPKLEINWR